MKVLMSPDSSDCHQISTLVTTTAITATVPVPVAAASATTTGTNIDAVDSNRLTNSIGEHENISGNIEAKSSLKPIRNGNCSVICSMSNTRQIEEETQASSTTNTPPYHQAINTITNNEQAPSIIVVGHSHLENALKMPSNFNVSSYYRHSKVLGIENDQANRITTMALASSSTASLNEYDPITTRPEYLYNQTNYTKSYVQSSTDNMTIPISTTTHVNHRNNNSDNIPLNDNLNIGSSVRPAQNVAEQKYSCYLKQSNPVPIRATTIKSISTITVPPITKATQTNTNILNKNHVNTVPSSYADITFSKNNMSNANINSSSSSSSNSNNVTSDHSYVQHNLNKNNINSATVTTTTNTTRFKVNTSGNKTYSYMTTIATTTPTFITMPKTTTITTINNHAKPILYSVPSSSLPPPPPLVPPAQSVHLPMVLSQPIPQFSAIQLQQHLQQQQQQHLNHHQQHHPPLHQLPSHNHHCLIQSAQQKQHKNHYNQEESQRSQEQEQLLRMHNQPNVVHIIPANSRPQTPDYIKSYPVMDTTVASSIKGEPELDIEFDGTTVLCRVCGDKASGFHYGVHSCEGCKGFFRRSIQQKIQYRPCTKNQQCSILRINRNRCQYCRLKKCIAVGMSRDAVRFGRVPKREKARIMAAMQQSTQNRGQQNALVTELDDQPRLMTTVLRAHLDTCAFTREKVAALRQQACECPTYSMPTLLACPLNPAPEFSSEMEFSQRFAYVIRGIIDFASKIPGFQFLNQDDKFTLLKAGLFDALFVRLFYMFDSSINSIICLNGEVIRRDDIQNGTNARFLVDSTFKFAERMNSMNLSDAEIGLFCAIVLFTPDRPGLRNVELIEKMYTSLKGCLQTIINQNRPEQPDFINTLLDTIPDLRTLSTLHTEKLVVFRTEHKDLLRQQICPDESRSSPPKSPQAWEDNRIDVEAKSPLGSVSSTESGDIDYQTASSTVPVIGSSSPSDTHNHDAHYQQASSLASTAPLLAATLSSSNILRNRANSGSSGDSNGDLDLIGSHAHLTQNGLTITPIIRAHPRQQLHQQQHHLNPSPGVVQRRYRKLDSPTDSGIESGNEKNESKAVSSGGSSSCSSPRSSVDDILDCPDGTTGTSVTAIATTIPVNMSVSPIRSPQPTTVAASSTSGPVIDNSGINPSTSTLKRQIAEDMPVLKRVLQAPPLYDTNSLMDEAYKPHKKFRALRHREYETIETDASSSTNINNTISTNRIPVSSPVHQIVSVPLEASAENTPLSAPPNITGQVLSVSAQAIVSLTTPSSPPSTTHHQNQSYVHLTRPSSSNANSNLMHEQQLSPIHPPQTQQPQLSSLSSTHSVLAKSLMAEPRMTPEQIKRSDIIQNYIMRDTNSNSLRICSPHGNGSRSPATQNLSINNNYAPSGCVGNASPSSSSSSNSNCTSPSRNQVSSMASPPPMENVAGTETGQISNLQRWQEHSVITTISINQRQSSVSPNSNGSLSSASSVHSTASSTNNSGCPYFQSPHSTSTSISPTHTTPPSSNHTHQHRHHATTPRLLELEVTIADSQQPLNLSKKSPNPPPNKLHALMAAATVAQRYPQVISDVAVTATTNSMLNNNSSSHNTNNNNNNNTNSSNSNNNSQVQVHKVMLEA